MPVDVTTPVEPEAMPGLPVRRRVDPARRCEDIELSEGRRYGILLLVTVTAFNQDNTEHPVPRFTIIDPRGREYAPSRIAATAPGGWRRFGTLDRGTSAHGTIAFEVLGGERLRLRIEAGGQTSFVGIGPR
jgi:hypothetical protein